jgi:cytoskeletal protein CcmA (bactofilin family)
MSLWQKPENDRPRTDLPSTTPAVTPPAATFHAPTPMVSSARSSGFIGQSIQIKGELTGNEDLTIDGRVEGKIDLSEHNLIVGENGHIHAEIHAKAVTVKGEVLGNIVADDKVEIMPSGSVEGDLCAPRVALADGSSFKGSVDMSGKTSSSSKSARAGASSNTSSATAEGMPRTASGYKG